MKNRFFLCFILICFASVMNAQVKFPQKMTKRLGVGWNLGNQFDAYRNGVADETCWGNGKVSQELFDSLSAAGVKSVRIPVTWLGHMGSSPEYTIEQKWMTRIKEVVEFAHNSKLNVILNIHHDGADSKHWLDIKRAATDSSIHDKVIQQFCAIWRQIAETFKQEGDYLIFESFNELHDGKWGWGANKTDNGRQYAFINELNQAFVNTIRSVGGKNSSRYLGIPGYCANIDLTINNIVIPKDRKKNRLLVAVHFYDPYLYTLEAKYRQWGKLADESLRVPGSDEETIAKELRKLFDTYTSKGMPVYIGEMGCVRRNNDEDEAIRIHYLSEVGKLCRTFHLSPFYWDNGQKNVGRECSGLIDHHTGKWYNDGKEVIKAIISCPDDVE